MPSRETYYSPGEDIRHGDAYQGDIYDDGAASLFDGVLSRRIFAFIVDACILLALMAVVSVVFFIIGLMTFGLLLPLLALVFPLTALGYTALTLGGERSATIGMRMVDLEMRTLYGAKMYPLLAIGHALAFYFSVAFLTPIVLLIALFNRRGRLLHDMLCGTLVVNRIRMIDAN